MIAKARRTERTGSACGAGRDGDRGANRRRRALPTPAEPLT